MAANLISTPTFSLTISPEAVLLSQQIHGTNVEPKNGGGLEDDLLFKEVIFRFQPLVSGRVFNRSPRVKVTRPKGSRIVFQPSIFQGRAVNFLGRYKFPKMDGL